MTTEEINANRRKYITALRRSKRQCTGELFVGDRVCAVGVAARTFLGIRNEKQCAAYGLGNAYDQVEKVLGLEDSDYLWHMNDREYLTFREIADRCEADWFGTEAK
jgi:hypothetical protein